MQADQRQIVTQDGRALRSASTRELLSRLVQDTTELVEEAGPIARSEIERDLRSEIAMAKGIGVAAVCMLLRTQPAARGARLRAHRADARLGSGPAGSGRCPGGRRGSRVVGWEYRVTRPLERTRRTLKEDVQWAKEQAA